MKKITWNHSSKEIEKKYLIRENGSDYATDILFQMYSSVQAVAASVLMKGKPIHQGYLALDSGLELSDILKLNPDFEPSEARLRDKCGEMFFTLKGNGGLSRNELAVEINKSVFDKYWPETKGKRVQKIRLAVPFEGHTLEIDLYTDRDLIVAEVEVPTAKDAQRLSPLGKDITNDKTYKNKNLAK